ncbi:hypothetical protein [Streptomyces sp. H27-C3]|nr:hypothetical protein [Streptomyces sp. H27-C3]MDJ0463175.1 hypothetical protein [Streptomyces sp. H27-C3]
MKHQSATACACGYDISEDEVRAYFDGEATCERCLDAFLTTNRPEQS